MFALDAVRQDSDQVRTHRDRLEFYWPGQQRSSSTSCGTHLWRFHRQQRSEPGASSSEPPPSCCGTQTRPAGTSSAPALSVCAWTEATEVERTVLKNIIFILMLLVLGSAQYIQILILYFLFSTAVQCLTVLIDSLRKRVNKVISMGEF